ncbi:alpha-(1,3)-fucosyltransferase 4-like [Huso huso]
MKNVVFLEPARLVANTEQQRRHWYKKLPVCYFLMMKLLCSQVYLAAFACMLLTVYLCFQKLPQASSSVPFVTGHIVMDPIIVLLWLQPFGKKRPIPDCQTLYNIRACTLTTDRDQYLRSQAVIIHHRDIRGNLSTLPQGHRPVSQRWIWMNFESPSHTSGLKKLGGVFNWTMSYRLDSDVFVPYGYLYPKKGYGSKKVSLPHKKKLVAWVISNWNEEHTRVKYYIRLRRHIPIDVYGGQGMELSNNSIVQTVSQYKFYLAFENSQHPDYITEKLWRNAFMSSAVPVVLGPGRANYELFLPPDSFIHIDDFRSPKVLADYLNFLDKNPKLYKKYFMWKKHYNVHVTSFWSEPYCSVCKAIRAAGSQTKTMSDLALWFEA